MASMKVRLGWDGGKEGRKIVSFRDGKEGYEVCGWVGYENMGLWAITVV